MTRLATAREAFRMVWAAHTISLVGSQITYLALPMIALVSFDASSSQLGLLNALGHAPFLVVGLVAGVWIDRVRRRPVLIASDLASAAVLGSIPVLGLVGALRLEYLYVLAFAAGTLLVFHDIAHQAFLPSLVPAAQLIKANSRLEASRAVARTIGPTLGGGLVQLLGAPIAIVLDALSFAVSAACLAVVRVAEPVAPSTAHRAVFWQDIGFGFRFALGHPLLRPSIMSTAILNLLLHARSVVYLVYLVRELALSPATIGLLFAAFGPAAVVGSLMAGALVARAGLGPTLVGSAALHGAACLLVPVPQTGPAVGLVVLALSHALLGFAVSIYTTAQLTLRQATIPLPVAGRVNATVRFCVWGTMPLGAIAGGFLGDAIGIYTSLVAISASVLLGALPLAASRLRNVRESVEALSAMRRDPEVHVAGKRHAG